MRVRGFLWRTVAHAAGRLAPAPMRAYHEAVTRSLVRALARDRDVIAVYGQGSYATGELRPGRSDVDLVTVVADHDVDGELQLLARLGRAYRRHQAILPIDLAVIPQAAFSESAALLARRRGRIATPGPMVALGRWKLLAGDELRGAPEPAHGHGWYVTEAHVARAVRAVATGGDVRAALGDLIHDVEREQVEWPSAHRLVAARSPADLVEAALALTDAQRDLVPIEAAPRTVDGWVAPPAPDAGPLAALDVPGPATLHRPPFSGRPELIVEGEPGVLAQWAVRGGARAVLAAGADLRLTTPRLAEEGWRGGFRAASILRASVPLAGEPLAARLRLPDDAVLRDQAATHAHGLLADARAALLGRRGIRLDPLLPVRLAAWRVLAAGGPLLGEERALKAAVPELAEPSWGHRALAAGRWVGHGR
jgi:predicted nucleotidyltransferase